MTRSKNGRELPQMQAVAYTKSLSSGIPVGAAIPGTAEVPHADGAANPTHGAAARCHGPNGTGKHNGTTGDAKGYEFSRTGARQLQRRCGMARLITSAGVIHSDIPA